MFKHSVELGERCPGHVQGDATRRQGGGDIAHEFGAMALTQTLTLGK